MRERESGRQSEWEREGETDRQKSEKRWGKGKRNQMRERKTERRSKRGKAGVFWFLLLLYLIPRGSERRAAK